MEHIKVFQKRIGATPDGEFGKETLLKAMEFFKISKEQCANFFGQCAHETGDFRVVSENLNYSESRMLSIFKGDFDLNKDRDLSAIEKAKAKSLVGNPDKIANFVYANQNGNGNEASGDGWKYRGRGALQLTGKGNYKLFADFAKDSLILVNPDVVCKDYFFDSALFYFKGRKLWTIASKIDLDSIKELTKKINGGYHGIQDRIDKTLKFYKLLS